MKVMSRTAQTKNVKQFPAKSHTFIIVIIAVIKGEENKNTELSRAESEPYLSAGL